MSSTSTAIAAPASDQKQIRARLKVLVRDYTHYKRWQTGYRNALKLKRDDEEQKRPTPYVLTPEYKQRMEGLLAQSDTWADEIKKEIADLAHQLPIWTEWAVAVKPMGEITIAYLEALVDLEEASDNQGRVVPGKVRRFCGYGPAEDKYAPGKRKYCASLKSQLYQWGMSLEKLGESCESKYHAIYLGIKERYANSDREVLERSKINGAKKIPWKDARPGHRRNAAIRRAVQEMLIDYVNARAALEGRKVRPPYAEEYLGKKHE
jgi:hypothetical protein